LATLSIIVPVYNEEEVLPEFCARLRAALTTVPCAAEILFVDDGSLDSTPELLEKLASEDERVRVLRFTRNFGHQAALCAGIDHCTGDAAVLMDADLQDPPELIPQFLEKWQQGYEVVYGVRTKREATRFLQVAYKAFYRVFRALSYIDVPRDAGDFSLMDRRVVDSLNLMPERDRFLRGLRAWVGFKQIGVPYVRPERMFGVTTNNLIKNIAWARKGIFSFSYVPLELISYLAFGVTTLAALALVFYLVVYFIRPPAVGGVMTLIVVTLFLGGIQLLCLAIIGDYLGRVFEEVKQRPLFVVKSILNDPRPKPPDQGPVNGSRTAS